MEIDPTIMELARLRMTALCDVVREAKRARVVLAESADPATMRIFVDLCDSLDRLYAVWPEIVWPEIAP